MRISQLDGGYHRTVEGYDRRKKEKKYRKMQNSVGSELEEVCWSG